MFLLLMFSNTKITFAQQDYPAANHPDMNLRDYRNWEIVGLTETDTSLLCNGSLLCGIGGDNDQGRAPQLSTMFGSGFTRQPTATGIYQSFQWNWNSGPPPGSRGPRITPDNSGNWGASVVEFKTQANEEIKVPSSGYEIDSEGRQVSVLYAKDKDITIIYGNQDTAAVGYVMHFVDLTVNPDILDLYNENQTQGRTSLVALPCGYPLGTALNSRFKVAIRDTGSFIDPRIEKDFWLENPTSTECTGDIGVVEVTNQRPLTDFKPLTIACDDPNPPDGFHPLRPYPANACDPLIPMSRPPAGPDTPGPDYKKYITYACGSPLTPEIEETFDPYGNIIINELGAPVDGYKHTKCFREANSLHVTCYRTEAVDLTVDLKDSNLGILGNTQDTNLTDAQKVNNYLSYYLTGVPQISDHEQITDEKGIDRLINFSGPLRKLLPWDLQNSQARATIVAAQETGIDVHNYKIGSNGLFGAFDQHLSETKVPPDMNAEKYKDNQEKYYKDLTAWRYGKEDIFPNVFGLDISQTLRAIFDLQTDSAKLFQNISLSSVEDTAGEYLLSIFGVGHQRQDLAVSNPQENTAPVKIVVRNASKAVGPPGSTTTLPSTYQDPKVDEKISCTGTLKIMPVGDSITVGLGLNSSPSTYPGYRGLLYKNLTDTGITVDYVGSSSQKYPGELTPGELPDDQHQAQGNQNTEFFLNGMAGWLNTSKPDIVLITVGTVNLTCIYKDPANPSQCDQSKSMEENVDKNVENVGKILEAINRAGAKAYLAKIPIRQDYPDASRLYNQKLEKYSEQATIVNLESTQISADKVHPTADGFKTMADIWTQAITGSCEQGGTSNPPQSACSVLYTQQTACDASGPYKTELTGNQLISFTNPYIQNKVIQISPSITSKLKTFLDYAHSQGKTVAALYGYRSKSQQLAECNQGDGAPAEFGQHRTGHAIDLYLIVPVSSSNPDGVAELPNDLQQKAISMGILHQFPNDTPHFCIP